jgi:23S rRNA (pseudouridine1915-N3)-methyltransferase
MQINIIAIGKLKDKAIKELMDEYIKRTKWKISITELEVKKNFPEEQMKIEEGKLLLAKVPAGSYKIVMDEKGEQFTSTKFANKISDLSNKGISSISFLIGGASGHSEEVRKAAGMVLSLSQMTFPHMLARLFLVEQVYRAYTIKVGIGYNK